MFTHIFVKCQSGKFSFGGINKNVFIFSLKRFYLKILQVSFSMVYYEGNKDFHACEFK